LSSAATWARLRDGTWGVRLVGLAAVAPGTAVTVLTRAGRAQTAVVDRIVWHGTDARGQPVTLARVRDADRSPAASARCVECGRPARTRCARCGAPLHTGCADAVRFVTGFRAGHDT
jgi:hypothetical protein